MLSFEETLFSGYAADMGLLMPEYIPKISGDQLKEWINLDFPSLAREILGLYVDEKEIPRDDLAEIFQNAYKKFDIEDVIEIKSLPNGLSVLELFHGPTRAFKDLSLQVIAQLTKYFLNKNKRIITVLVGTSGDTGSAVIEAYRGFSTASVMVLFPKGRIAETQELLMTTVMDKNIHCFEVDGTSDDLDVPIRKIFEDETFCRAYNVISANSVNLVRVLVQIAHFFYAYLRFASRLKSGQALRVVVPFGGGGNIAAACIAQQMGLPIEIVAALNSNDIFAQLLNSEELYFGNEVAATLASAMDIGVPYNIERLLYIFSGYNTKCTSEVMQKLYLGEKVAFPPDVITEMGNVIIGYHVSDNTEIISTMQKCWSEEKYLICPHTATAVAYHYQECKLCDGLVCVCVATASPSKFPEALLAAGLPDEERLAENLRQKPKRVTQMSKGEDWEDVLRCRIKMVSIK